MSPKITTNAWHLISSESAQGLFQTYQNIYFCFFYKIIIKYPYINVIKYPQHEEKFGLNLCLKSCVRH